MRCTLAIFDLDGTLIDSVGGIHRALNLLLADYGFAPLPLTQVTGMVGDGASNLIERAFAVYEHVAPDIHAEVRRFLEHYATDPVAHTKLYEGVEKALQELRDRGVTLAICTNKPLQISEVILAKLEVADYFSAVLGGDSRAYRKPDPRMLHELLQQFGVKPAQAVLVGDSEVDAATAQSAGVPFVLVTFGYHRALLEEIPCTATIDHFDELVGTIERT